MYLHARSERKQNVESPIPKARISTMPIIYMHLRPKRSTPFALTTLGGPYVLVYEADGIELQLAYAINE